MVSKETMMRSLNPVHWVVFLFWQFRVFRWCIRLLHINRCGTQAAALSYHTMFGVVPLVIVLLMVFQMFQSQDQASKVREFLYKELQLSSITMKEEGTDSSSAAKSISLTEKLDEMSNKYIGQINKGAISIVGGLLVFWAAIGGIGTIEKSFNSIWGISRGRDFLERMINYWTLLTLGPLLLGAGIYISASGAWKQAVSISILSVVWSWVRPALPFVISWLGIFSLYFVMPHAKVRVLPALWGALVAAILWTTAKFGFGLYVTKLIPYQAMYGVMGIIPLAVFWVYVIWVILLFGLQLTYATQNLKTLDEAEQAIQRKNQGRFLVSEQTVFAMMIDILSAFEKKDQPPITVDKICASLDIPSDFASRILEHMVKAGLLCRTSDPVAGYVPSTDGAHITLADIFNAVDAASFTQVASGRKLQTVLGKMQELLGRFTLKDILDTEKTDLPPAQE